MKTIPRLLGIAMLSALACSAVDKDPGETEGHGGGGGGPQQGGAGGAPATGTCTYDGKPYSPDDSFISVDSCNRCFCVSDGSVLCTTKACTADCILDSTYTFYWEPGSAANYPVTSLSPPNRYQVKVAANLHQGPAVPPSCAPAMPLCHSEAIDVADVMSDLADADVQAALIPDSSGHPRFFGQSTNGEVDLGNFRIMGAGGGFGVGVDCPSSAASTCTPIPAGVAKLVADLRALEAQQLADPSCSALVYSLSHG
jgi:hypothetical protein